MRSVVEVKRSLVLDGNLDSDAKLLVILLMMEGGALPFTKAADLLGWDYSTVEDAAGVLRREQIANTERDGLTLGTDERTSFTARRYRVTKRVEEAKEKSAVAAEIASKRRADSRAARAAKIEPEVVEAPVHEPNANDVEIWFRAAVTEKYGDVRMGRWIAREKSHGKQLLRDYGPDLTKRAIRYFVAQFENMGAFDGLPGIRLFYAMRERVFGALQRGDTGTKHADEFDSTKADKAPDSGW